MSGKPVGSYEMLDYEDLQKGNSALSSTINSPDNMQPSHVVGDLNDDGFLDVAWVFLNADYEDNTDAASESFGRIFIAFGKEEGFEAKPEFTAANATGVAKIWGPSRHAGCHLQDCSQTDIRMTLYIEDLNGDGVNDLIVASPGSATNKDGQDQVDNGRIDVIFGVSGDWSDSIDLSDNTTYEGFTFWPKTDRSGNFGRRVQIEDYNDDGFKDLAVLDNVGLNGTGTVFVLFGESGNRSDVSAPDLNGTNGMYMEVNANENTMATKLFGGDLNGDDIADLIIQINHPNGGTGKMNIYVVYGNETLPNTVDLDDLDGSDGFLVTSPQDPKAFNDAVTTGDFNGDGIEDLAFGTPERNLTGLEQPGELWVVFGASNRSTGSIDVLDLNGTDGFSLKGDSDDAYVGWNLNKGDFNGDSITDLAFSVPGTPDSGIAGKVGILFGSKEAFNASYDVNTDFLDGTHGVLIECDDFFKVNYVMVDDYNNDGLADLFLFPISYSFYVVFGKPTFNSPYNLGSLDGIDGFEYRLSEEDKITAIQGPPTDPSSVMEVPKLANSGSNSAGGISILLDVLTIKNNSVHYYKTLLEAPPRCEIGNAASRLLISHFALEKLTLDAANFYVLSAGCHSLYTNGDITYSWSCTQAGSSDPCLDVNDTAISLMPDDTKSLMIEGGTLKPDQNLEFKLEVMQGSNKSVSIIAVDTHCNTHPADVMLTQGPIVIDVVEAHNISIVSDSHVSLEQCQGATSNWAYTWSCRRLDSTESCMDSDNNQLSLTSHATVNGLVLPAESLKPNQILMFGATIEDGGVSVKHFTEVHTITKKNNGVALGLGFGLGFGLGVPIIFFIIIKIVMSKKGLTITQAGLNRGAPVPDTSPGTNA